MTSASFSETYIEPWMRGTHTDVAAVGRAVLRATIFARCHPDEAAAASKEGPASQRGTRGSLTDSSPPSCGQPCTVLKPYWRTILQKQLSS